MRQLSYTSLKSVTAMIVCLWVILQPIRSDAQELYFPPVNNQNWETISPDSLGWCADSLNALQDYLGDQDTKAFIILKNGKLAVEWYYDGFGQDSLWYWASAAKSLMAMLVGIAQEEGHLSIADSVSAYLGDGWTDCVPEEEGAITIWNQLTMSNGLDDSVPDNHCTLDSCLQCLAEPGTRWAYHNAPYTLLRNVMESATSININQYYWSRIGLRIGAGGGWIKSDYNNLMISKALDMARYGLLVLAGGNWANDTILADKSYYNSMINTSQLMNKSYGYLWWLNGKSSYMLPGFQLVIPSDLVPNAPDDMFAALGKNDQKLYVVPSQDLVVVRMGNAVIPGPSTLSSFDNTLWEKIASLDCEISNIDETQAENLIVLYPNPVTDHLIIRSDFELEKVEIRDINAQLRMLSDQHALVVSQLTPGTYILRILLSNGRIVNRMFIKQ
jgi:CubicO group peptidase (beta-lactamase class C family)